jgi:hypothetical protein
VARRPRAAPAPHERSERRQAGSLGGSGGRLGVGDVAAEAGVQGEGLAATVMRALSNGRATPAEVTAVIKESAAAVAGGPGRPSTVERA